MSSGESQPPCGGHGVAVPASSANLGPGFDSLAVALDIRLQVRTIDRAEARVVTSGYGAGELPSDDSNLIWRSFTRYCDAVGVDVPDVSLAVDNAIPLERGMGSSAAAVVAGLALARVATGVPVGALELIDLAAETEGHPDNAAAAVLGGVVLCVPGRIRRLEPTDGLRPVVCVPDSRQSTTEARGLLPATVSFGDAAVNGARVAAVLAGMTGMTPLDAASMTDVLHEPARLAAMAESGRLVAELREAGVPACLSGAGPSVLAVVASGSDSAVDRVRRLAGNGWEVLAVGWDRAGTSSCP